MGEQYSSIRIRPSRHIGPVVTLLAQKYMVKKMCMLRDGFPHNVSLGLAPDLALCLDMLGFLAYLKFYVMPV